MSGTAEALSQTLETAADNASAAADAAIDAATASQEAQDAAATAVSLATGMAALAEQQAAQTVAEMAMRVSALEEGMSNCLAQLNRLETLALSLETMVSLSSTQRTEPEATQTEVEIINQPEQTEPDAGAPGDPQEAVTEKPTRRVRLL